MPNWKEKLRKTGYLTGLGHRSTEELLGVIEIEIIEKMIEDAERIADQCDSMSGMDLNTFGHKLRAKWLGKINI